VLDGIIKRLLDDAARALFMYWRYVVLVQTGCCFVTIEQHGNARVVTAHADNGAKLLSQAWATYRSECAHFEPNADRNSTCLAINYVAHQYLPPQQQKPSSTNPTCEPS
jgi:hypothetical protein